MPRPPSRRRLAPGAPRGSLLKRLRSALRAFRNPPRDPPSAEPAPEAPAPPLTPEVLYERRESQVNWNVTWADHLTPLHLATQGDAPDHDLIARPLRVQAANLCVLFLADWSRRSPDGTRRIAAFAGQGHEVRVVLPEPGDPLAVVGGAAAKALVTLVEWAYTTDKGGERLSFVQSTIARALGPGDDPEAAYRSLIAGVETIFGQVRTEWKFFLDEKVEEFVHQVQALEDEVAATVQAFADRTSAMIKSLSDTALAAVAALLGSFIATLVKGGAGLFVLWIGVAAYLVYLVVFPLAYNMTQQWQSFTTLGEQFAARRQRIELRLSAATVEGIVKARVRRSQERYRVWFWCTVAAYLLIAGAMIAVVRCIGPRLQGG